MNPTSPPSGPPRIFQAELSLSAFSTDWTHCAQVADYAARFAAADQFDSDRAASQLSAGINELLELAWALHDADAPAPLRLDLHKPAPNQVTARLCVPILDAHAPQYQAIAARAAHPAPLDLLASPAPGDGVLELVSLHGAAFSLDAAEPASVTLSLSITFE